MAQCGAESLGPYAGGTTFFARNGSQSTPSGGHTCPLEAGHDGPHCKVVMAQLSDTVAVRTRYVWQSQHELQALVDVVPVVVTVSLAR